MTCDFQQCGILTSEDSDEPVQPPLKRRNSKWYSVCSLTLKEYSSDQQRLWSDCAYAQAGLSLCWSHIPHCWKSHATAQLWPLASHKAPIKDSAQSDLSLWWAHMLTCNRLRAKKGPAPPPPPPLGNFADISYLEENFKPHLLRDVCTLCSGALVSDSLLHMLL